MDPDADPDLDPGIKMESRILIGIKTISIHNTGRGNRRKWGDRPMKVEP